MLDNDGRNPSFMDWLEQHKASVIQVSRVYTLTDEESQDVPIAFDVERWYSDSGDHVFRSREIRGIGSQAIHRRLGRSPFQNGTRPRLRGQLRIAASNGEPQTTRVRMTTLNRRLAWTLRSEAKLKEARKNHRLKTSSLCRVNPNLKATSAFAGLGKRAGRSRVESRSGVTA